MKIFNLSMAVIAACLLGLAMYSASTWLYLASAAAAIGTAAIWWKRHHGTP